MFVILLVVVPVHLLRVLQLTLSSLHRLVQYSDVIHIDIIVYTMMEQPELLRLPLVQIAVERMLLLKLRYVMSMKRSHLLLLFGWQNAVALSLLLLCIEALGVHLFRFLVAA